MASIDLLLWYLNQYAGLLPAPVMILLVLVFRDLRTHMKSSRSAEIRNCVHHAAMFSKLEIDQMAVLELERQAGLKPGKDADYNR